MQPDDILTTKEKIRGTIKILSETGADYVEQLQGLGFTVEAMIIEAAKKNLEITAQCGMGAVPALAMMADQIVQRHLNDAKNSDNLLINANESTFKLTFTPEETRKMFKIENTAP
jgi:hypothetical protein